MKQKKGMSNLVSTVLLVTSTIAIAILIFLWISHSIKEETEKSTDIGTSEKACKNIELKINEVSRTIDPNTITVNVENLKNRKITALRIRLESKNEVEMKKIQGEIEGYETKTFEIEANTISIDRNTKIKIIPEIILQKPEIKTTEAGWWLCSNKAVEATLE